MSFAEAKAAALAAPIPSRATRAARARSILARLGLVGLILGCTPEQRGPARTALEVNQCLTALTLERLRDGADMADPAVLAQLAVDVAVECALVLLPPE